MRCFIVFMLMQAQPERRLSWYVWSAAGAAFVLAATLLVLFYRRMHRTERDADNWTRPDQTIFGTGAPVDIERSIEPERDAPPAAEIEEHAEPVSEPRPSVQPAPPPGTREVEQPVEREAPRSTTEMPPPGPVEDIPALRALQDVEPPPEGTQLLGSAPAAGQESQAAGQEDELEAAVFDDEIWAELEARETKGLGPPKTAQLASGEPDLAEDASAKVSSENRPRFVPPTISPLNRRAPDDAPRVEPVTTREAPSPAAHVEEPGVKRPAPEPGSAREAAGSAITSAGAAGRGGVRAGSILGLPPEGSAGPLVLGEAKPRGDITIGSLSSYGKPVDEGGGKGGTIALVVTMLLIGGFIAAYMYVPSFQSKVLDLAARVRGQARSTAPAPPRPRARIFPAASVVESGVVKARGAVDNITEETLEGLVVEVTLRRQGSAEPEVRNVNLNPDTLAPRQRGIFEFEYDGKEFAGYRVTKLFDKNGETPFSSPAQRP